jgi:hypothetical protein
VINVSFYCFVWSNVDFLSGESAGIHYPVNRRDLRSSDGRRAQCLVQEDWRAIGKWAESAPRAASASVIVVGYLPGPMAKALKARASG